jgi:GNAT superfamily N-acetyltransferase
VLRSRGDVVAIAFRTLNRNGYFNLYDIATNPRHLNRGHGRQLWRLLIAHAHENRSTRIKMGCSPSSVGWHIGNGAVFWGVDEQGSLLCDMPLMPTIEQQLLLQQEAVTDPAVVMPDAKVIAKLRARGLKKETLKRKLVPTLNAIQQAREYWLRSAISPNESLPEWRDILPARSEYIRPVTKQQFTAAITDHKDDKFAKTFVAKANTQKLWKDCVGYWKGNTLCAAIITKHSAREPKTANLTLLHTFAKHRGKGYGTRLVEDSLQDALRQGCLYYRVSSEFEATPFYRKLGFKFLGRQKTAELSMFRLNGPSPKDGSYDITDPHIAKSVLSSRRGGIAETYEFPR